mmetsp:Transcript_73495/g.237809  ORF Transcript_73495/g.237809 Transcript_73495/m.237809 type:complete len:307 (+) Transcript_73495:729-1649(+)
MHLAHADGAQQLGQGGGFRLEADLPVRPSASPSLVLDDGLALVALAALGQGLGPVGAQLRPRGVRRGVHEGGGGRRLGADGDVEWPDLVGHAVDPDVPQQVAVVRRRRLHGQDLHAGSPELRQQHGHGADGGADVDGEQRRRVGGAPGRGGVAEAVEVLAQLFEDVAHGRARPLEGQVVHSVTEHLLRQSHRRVLHVCLPATLHPAEAWMGPSLCATSAACHRRDCGPFRRSGPIGGIGLGHREEPREVQVAAFLLCENGVPTRSSLHLGCGTAAVLLGQTILPAMDPALVSLSLGKGQARWHRLD